MEEASADMSIGLVSVDMLAGMLTDTPSILGWYVGRNLVHMF